MAATLYGFRDLAFLKARLLPGDMGEESDYDADLMEIGKGVAAWFDAFTGRRLRRVVGAVFECAADVDFVVLPSYPIEEVTAVTVTGYGSTRSAMDLIRVIQRKAGVVDFAGAPGSNDEVLAVTSTGGFWCDDGEVMPVGATAMPDDLVLAWIQQCRAVCEAEDTFRQKGAGKDAKKGGLEIGSLELVDGVRKVLCRYMRFP